MTSGQMSFVLKYSVIRLLILTGARHSEILELRWTQVDLQRKVLTFSADQHKTGRKTGAKTLPLNPPAIAILESISKVQGIPYVIQGDKPGSHFVGQQKKRPEEAVNIEDVRIHDLRHTFASVGVSQGLSLPVVGSLLGHSQPSVTPRYAHLADDPKAEASEQIAKSIARNLGAPGK